MRIEVVEVLEEQRIFLGPREEVGGEVRDAVWCWPMVVVLWDAFTPWRVHEGAFFS